MKIREMIALCLIIIVLAGGCSKQSKIEGLKLGRYVMQGTELKGSSWVLLKENNQFMFNRNLAASYVPLGTYSIKDEKLILYVNENESYIFIIDGDKLIFEGGDKAGNLVKKGAVFELSDEE